MKRALQALILMLLALHLFAQENAEDFGAFLTLGEKVTLSEKGELSNFGARLSDLSLWSRSPFAAAIRRAIQDGPSTIAAEELILVDRPKNTAAADLDMEILRSFTAFTTMKGLLVYSDSLKRMETFIYDSYRVTSLQDKVALPDPAFKVLPERSGFTLYQKEEQTGNVYSRMTVDFADGRAYVFLTNLTDLKFFGLRLVAPGELKTLFVVTPQAEKLELYSVTVANTPRFFGLERMKRKSFFYRMKALASWFEANLLSTTSQR